MERLSVRGQANVGLVVPRMPPSVLEGREDNENVDLATAESWVLRDRMVEFCRDALNTSLEPKHLSWPVGFYGNPRLVRAIADFSNTMMKPYKPILEQNISVLPGSGGSLMGLLFSLCEPGDGILAPAPYWFGFNVLALIRAGVTLVDVNMPCLEEAMSTAVLESLRQAYDSATVPVKALLVSNPSNPIGQPWARDIMEGMVRFCQEKNIHLISDEVFGSVSFDCPDMPVPTPFTSILQLDPAALGCDEWRLHAIWSPSKSLGLSGLRIGAVITRAGPELLNALALASFGEVSIASSLVLLHILTSPALPEVLQQSSRALTEHYTLLTDALKELHIPYVPCNAGLSLLANIAPDAKTWDDEKAIVETLKEAGVLVSSGRAYQMPEADKGWVRITFAVDRKALEEGIMKMKQVLEKIARTEVLTNGV